MKPLLIVNPASSGGRAGRVFPELLRPIEIALGPCEVAFTERAGHAREIAQEAAGSGRGRIIAIGGDGTFSEVAGGVLASKQRAAVGLIHQGTGGDFRRSLGLEHRLDRYLEALARGTTRSIDAGRLSFEGRGGAREERFFVNVTSLGMGGLVDRYVAEGSRLFGAGATYFLASLKALALGAVGRLACELTLDGRTTIEHVETRSLAVCNGRYFGGGMHVAPMASLDDGVFELIAIGGEHRGATLAVAQKLYKGEHLGMSGVRHLRASELTIRLIGGDGARFPLDVDGEYAGQAPVTITALPRALDVLA